MIDFVEGTIAYLDVDYVVVEAGGIGYRLFCPNPYAFAQDEGKARRFYTHHHVREDAILLYGFASRGERDLFRKLLEVSGIGPKGALGILAGAAPEQIVFAVQQENVTYLTKFPGIGKKTAQRMILDLKDKLNVFPPSAIMPPAAAPLFSDKGSVPQLDEALEALFALGYTETEIQKIKAALKQQAEAGGAVDQLVRQGLALLMRG
jgi:Holliday junction DNA helicase RuvA